MNTRRFGNALILLVTALSCGGCTPATLAVRPVQPNEQVASGVVYSLPRTVLALDVSYSVAEETTWHAKTDGTPDKSLPPVVKVVTATVADPVVVRTVVVPDAKLRFKISPDSLLRAGLSVQNGKIGLTKEGFLTSFAADVEDRSGAIATNVLKGAIGIVKLAAVAGNNVVESRELKKLVMHRLLELEDLQPDPTDPAARVYDDFPLASAAVGQIAPGVVPPSVKVELRVPAASLANSVLSADDVTKLACPDAYKSLNGAGAGACAGLFLRVPGSVPATIKIRDVPVAKDTLLVAQAGMFTYIPIASKKFASRKIGITADSTTGGLTELSFASSSSAEGASKAAADLSAELLSNLKTLKTDRLQAEIDALKKKQELAGLRDTGVEDLTAQIELLKKQKELLDAQKALEAAQKGGGQ